MIQEQLAVYRSTDIYLIDQIMRGRIQQGMRVLDAACGGGRNIPALLSMHCTVTGIDINQQAIDQCRQVFANASFHQQDLTELDDAKQYDLVIANAIFHFADGKEQFNCWADNLWHALDNKGVFFARLSTRIGLKNVNPPGFSFLAEEQDLLACEQRWQARRIDPLKTTLVEDKRTMSTWVLQKP